MIWNWFKKKISEKIPEKENLYNIYLVKWDCILKYSLVNDETVRTETIRRTVRVTDYDKFGEKYGYYVIDPEDLIKEKVVPPVSIHSTHFTVCGYVNDSDNELSYNIERSALFTWNTKYTLSMEIVGQTPDKHLFQVLKEGSDGRMSIV